MLILRNIIITILLLILAAISVVGIMVEWPPVLNWTPDRINAIGRSVLTIMRPSLLLFLVWWLILLSTLLVLFLTIVRPRRRMKIEVQMGGGRVVIMDAAIKKYIRNALSELGEVTVKKIDLREHRNLVVTNIIADVRTRENLPTLERRIIGRVRAALAEDLGITNLGDVHVVVRNFEVSGRDDTGRPVTPEPADKSEMALKRDETPERLESHEKTVPPVNDSPVYESPSADPLAAPLADPVATSEEVAQPIILTETDSPKSRFESPSGNASTFDATETGSDKPENIETSDSEAVNFGDQVLQDQEDKPGATHHTDLDEPLPWGKPYSDTKDDDEEKDEDKKDSRPL